MPKSIQNLLSFILISGMMIFCSETVTAQLLDAEDQKYTRADSLRGTLSELRSCYDVTYYHLDLKVDPETRTINGSNKIVFRNTVDYLKFQIDLFEEMQIRRIVNDKDQLLKFTREGAAVFVDLGQKMLKGETGEITVYYGGAPIIAKRAPWDGGFTWAKDLDDNHWIGVSCEGIGASLWWPNKDHLSDEVDSMAISITVPEDLVFVGNGQMRNAHDSVDGWQKYDWFVSYPINNYNVTLNIGNYVHFGETFKSIKGDLAVDYYVMPYNLDTAKEHFKQVIPMLACYEQYFDPYPYFKDGFALVETPYLGMEHQGAIAYGNGYKTGYAGFDYSRIGLDFDYIIIHETGHEWWGNSVSCKDIADLWLHEGFCTYSEALYVECKHGYDIAMDYVNAKKPGVGNEAPLIGDYLVNSEGSSDMYSKGMLILNTLRHTMDDDEKWFSIVRGLTVDFKNTTVSSAEVEDYIATKSGLNLDKFWDQYLRQASPPVLETRKYKKGKKLIVEYRWKAIDGFDMPLKASYERDGEEFTMWIKPTTEWRSKVLKKVESDSFKWDEAHFYYLIDKGMEKEDVTSEKED